MEELKNNRRSFLKQGALLGIGGLAAAKLIAQETGISTMDFKPGNYRMSANADGEFKQEKLPYSFADLEPHIDAETMEIHYGKHHAGYVSKLNAAISGETPEKVTNLELIFPRISGFPDAIRNNAGGHYNHTMFWKMMTPGGVAPNDEFQGILKEAFGSLEEFQKMFTEAASSRFGSGWAWLVVQKDKSLAIGSTANQDNPLMDVSEFRGAPILCLDVWEHAYYLKYRNMRGDYIKNWWNLVNWDMVYKYYEEEM